MTEMTRRVFLDTAAKTGVILGSGGLVAACGSSSTPKSASTRGAAVQPRRGGTLRAGVTGGSSSDTVDPQRATLNTDYGRITQLYDTLVWLDADVRPYFKLAEEMTPNKDATVWTIRLRQGVTFHNGKDVTADDVIYSINRVVNPKSPGVAQFAVGPIHAAGIKKLDSRTISVPFSKPYSVLVEALSVPITIYIVPVGYDPKRPIGSGPFKYVSFTPGQQSVFARNENYWDTPLPYADELVITDYSDETSQVNALLSGQVDIINDLSQVSLGTVTGSGKNAVIAVGGAWNPFTMRVDQPPFTDVRVRTAFKLAVDREKMLQTVFGGHGTLGNDIFAIWDPMYDHTIPQRQYDPEQAKSLLKAAGHENLSIQLVSSPAAQGMVNMAQVYAQQAAAAGLNIAIKQVTVADFYGPNYLKWIFGQDFWYYNPYFPQVNEGTLPGGAFNETHFNNPKYNLLYNEALATLDKTKQTDIAHEMQRIDYDEGGNIIPFFPATIDGYGTNVHGVVQNKTGGSFNSWDLKRIWLS